MAPMGRLITRVREAEERLAAIARTLQSAYEEELAEARAARESAVRGLRHAEAMEQAAVALGRGELASRLREVCEQFRASESAARKRAEELSDIEATITMQLGAPSPESPERPALTSSASPPIPSRAPEVVVAGPDAADRSPSSPAVAPPEAMEEDAQSESFAAPESELVRELLGRVRQLEPRVDQVARVGPRAPREELRLAVQEHVALARLLQERLDAAGWDGQDATQPSIDKLIAITAAHALEGIVGVVDGEAADWNRVAAEARAQRQVLAEARKRGS